VLGRFLQGAAMRAVLLTVAITRQICTQRVGMTAVGIVTSGSSVLGVGALFVLNPAIEAFGYRSVFVAAAVLAVICGVSGVLASRVGPVSILLAGIVVGLLATIGMLVGVSVLPVGLVCATLLGVAVGVCITSGYKLATTIAPPEHHGAVGSLVTVVLCVGSVVLNVVGVMVLNATATDTLVAGVPANSLTGVQLYILMGVAALVAAAALATVLVRRRG
jgi:MFS family permease